MMKKLFSTRTFLLAVQVTVAISAGMFAGAMWRLKHTEGKGAITTDSTNVRVTTRREGDQTRVYVHNLERSEVTMTFDFKVVNLKSDVTFPYTATFAPGETEAFVLAPNSPDKPWEYAYTNYFKLGSALAVPDGYLYTLPYEPGATFKVTQAFGGSFSHTGSNKYAIDWKMPEGTPIYAARGGLVIKSKDDSDLGGGSIRYDRYNNYVLIRHDDGTLGHYCHLLKDGVRVFPGQLVEAGEVIALSGNTGFSSGPHLHFCVFKTVSGRERVSIPIQFRGDNGAALTLVEGRRYTAPVVQQQASSQSTLASSVLQ
ncbi:MAG TPA: M23 family metallopeptidase [Verrucomicrobiae bacterium]|nr:M23 family metallopeptidase [Verrucomicrobiae bacterium]